MKVLDRYITRELFFPIVACSMVLVFLILIADLFNNLDEILRNKAPFLIILRYYASMVPFALTQTIAWATWLGTLFLLVTFGFHNETTAMKAAGLTITEIIRPVVFLGFLLGIGIFLLNDRIVPPTYRTAKEIEDMYIDKKHSKQKEKFFQNVTYYSGRDLLYYFRSFSNQKNEVKDAIILWLGTGPEGERKKVTAKRGTYQDETWTFEEITEYQTDSRGRILGEPKTFSKKTYPEITFTPQDLKASTSDSPFLSYRDLKATIQKLKENGVNVTSETADLQARLAAPWQGLIMMLVTVPLLARTTNRKAIALNVLICVALVFTFHVTQAVGMALGKAGKLTPFLSAWFGNIIFATAALMNLERANY